MFEFITKLFDTSCFPPRWHCGNWTAGHGWLHILSDLGVWSAYLAIPCVLGYFVLRRKDIPFRTIFLLFGAFILACGTTHLMEALIFWWPAYRLAGVIKLLTAIVSWSTVVALVPVVPKVLAMRSPEELEREIRERTAELTQANEALRAEVRERHRSEEEITRLNRELRSRADELQTILNMVPIGVAIAHDPLCRRITHNPYMSELLNVPAWANASLTAPQEERPTNFTNYWQGEEVPTSELPMQVACTGVEVRDMELDLVCQGRDPRTMLYYARPLFDGEGRVRGSVGACVDITSRRQAEEALQASQEQLAAELEAMSRLHDLGTRLLACADLQVALNDVLEGAMRTTRADFGNIQLYNPEIKALEIAVQRGFRQDFLDYFRTVQVDDGSACAQAMQSGERIIIEDVQLDPTFEPHRQIAAAANFRAVQSTPLKSRNGKVLGMVSTHFRQPQQMSERDQRLLDFYARHAADFIERLRIEEALKDADHRKDEFLATLAHELRNPLAPIRNGLQVMRMVGDDRDAVEQARTMMDRQLTQLVRLVDDLMDVSRITRGKVELRKEQVQLATVVNSAVETSRPVIEQMGHQLTVTLPKLPVYLDADLTRLAQVFLNLLTNAGKYTERGGQIWLTAERQGSDVVVSVKDTGIGIAADQLPRLFEMFSQLHHSLERSQGGLGIGLTLVKRLVEMHGGRIEARSDGPGKGSEFIVRLPVVVEASKPQASEDMKEGDVKTSLRILIVDDNRDGADSLSMMLKMMGNDTRTAYDGEEAVAATVEFWPDVILLDIGLPKLTGYEACRLIREQSGGIGIIIIAQTGWGQEEDRQRTHKAGFDHHLVKPVDPQALMKLLAGLQAAKKE